MKNKWWSSQPVKVLKKYPEPFIDGISYTWNAYAKLMTYIKKVKPGMPMYNPYKGEWSEVKKVTLHRTPITRDSIFSEKLSHKYVGSYISLFTIEMVDNYILYDIDLWNYMPLNNFVKNDSSEGVFSYDSVRLDDFFKGLVRFNRFIGESDLWPGPWYPKSIQDNLSLSIENWISYFEKDEHV